MEFLVSLLIGILVAASVYCILRRSIIKFVIGIAFLSQAVNLLVFTTGGISQAAPPIIQADQTTIIGEHADPLPQALVLTAIVIGFGLLVFTLALAQRATQAAGTDDLEAFRNTEQ
ncbi:MAG: Na+/H+ antiporter subunit C [Verrucomicrobiota bacterium]